MTLLQVPIALSAIAAKQLIASIERPRLADFCLQMSEKPRTRECFDLLEGTRFFK